MNSLSIHHYGAACCRSLRFGLLARRCLVNVTLGGSRFLMAPTPRPWTIGTASATPMAGEDGAVVADKGKGGHLVSKNSYKDFQIRAEFWADHTTNSGIFIRISDPKNIGAKTAYEVNIYDQRPDPEYGTGAIVNFAKVSPMPKAGGKWNTYEITPRARS